MALQDTQELVIRGHTGVGQRVFKNVDYTVGWICALPLELAAAKAMFDNDHPKLSVAPGDKNTYSLGQIASHNVVVTCLPQGTIGTNAAVTVATNLTRSFACLRVVLLVGVGGGAPDPNVADPESDIRLGDVVVSKPFGDHGGVIQYDFGKTLQSKEFQRQGCLNKPAPILRSAISELEAMHLLGESEIPAILESLFISRPKLAKPFKHPGQSQDCLFNAAYEHQNGQIDCSACSRENIVQRTPRDTLEPIVHYGSIASANQIMRDAKIRDKLRRELGILCFEMEAAGLMDNFPCVVIRGICDYSDSHKNKQWQQYAAITAAACAKELLQSLPASSVEDEDAIQIVSDPMGHTLLEESNQLSRQGLEIAIEQHERQQQEAVNEKAEACLQILSTCNYENMKNTNPDRAVDTCLWVLEDSQFKSWQRADSSKILWISADPGCGKSVLSKFLVDDIFNDSGEYTTCYFFFKDNELQKNLATALCALLHRLFSLEPELIKVALYSYKQYGKRLPEQVDELWRILVNVGRVKSEQKIVCILDGLDECNEADLAVLMANLRIFYAPLRQNRTSEAPAVSGSLDISPPESCSPDPGAAEPFPARSGIKFLFTSRPYHYIQTEFEKITVHACCRIRGERKNESLNKEINLVIQHEMSDLATELSLSVDVERELVEELQSMKNRTYLWLHLAKADIRDTYYSSLAPDEEVISRLPKNVEEAYRKLLNRVNARSRNSVRRILEIVIGARRPFTVQEMANALAQLDDLKNSRQASSTIDSVRLEKNICQWCGLFVFVKDQRIYLIHETAKEFLLLNAFDPTNTRIHWDYFFDRTEVEITMAKFCMQHLTSVLELHSAASDHSSTDLQKLLQYPIENWSEHVRESQTSATNFPLQMILRFYHIIRKSRTNILTGKLKDYFRRLSQMSLISLIAYHGHEVVLKHVLSTDGGDVNEKDREGRTALVWAVLQGHETMVRALIDAGAHIAMPDNRSLRVAATKGNLKILSILLEGQSDLSQDVEAQEALVHAARNGHSDVIEMFIDHSIIGAYVYDQKLLDLALRSASRNGHNEAIHKLLDYGAKYNNCEDVAKLLLEVILAGHELTADIIIAWTDNFVLNDDLVMALSAAVTRSFTAVTYDLLQWISSLVEDMTVAHSVYHLFGALYQAAKLGSNELVRLLLKHIPHAISRGNAQKASRHNSDGYGYNEDDGLYIRGYENAVAVASVMGHYRPVEHILTEAIDSKLQWEMIFVTALQYSIYVFYPKVIRIALERLLAAFGANAIDISRIDFGRLSKMAQLNGDERLALLLQQFNSGLANDGKSIAFLIELIYAEDWTGGRVHKNRKKHASRELEQRFQTSRSPLPKPIIGKTRTYSVSQTKESVMRVENSIPKRASTVDLSLYN